MSTSTNKVVQVMRLGTLVLHSAISIGKIDAHPVAILNTVSKMMSGTEMSGSASKVELTRRRSIEQPIQFTKIQSKEQLIARSAPQEAVSEVAV